MELNFTVTNQKIKYVSNLYIVEKSRNYLTAKFSFSGSEWKDVPKTAIFKKDDTVINVLLDENGRCDVPWEVITKGTLKVSVFGGDLVTVDTADVKILKSGYEEGNAPSEPTSDVYSQILAELQSIRSDFITEEMLGQAVEDWLAENVVEALSPTDVEKIVYDYLDEHKDELKGEKGAVFTPHVSDEGVMSWTNDGGLENPPPVELKINAGGEYALVTEAGYSIVASIDEFYVLTVVLKNKAGNVLSTSEPIDLPIESMIIHVDYDEESGILTFSLQNGQTLFVNISTLVRGLVPTSRKIAGVDLADDITAEELKEALGIYEGMVSVSTDLQWGIANLSADVSVATPIGYVIPFDSCTDNENITFDEENHGFVLRAGRTYELEAFIRFISSSGYKYFRFYDNVNNVTRGISGGCEVASSSMYVDAITPAKLIVTPEVDTLYTLIVDTASNTTGTATFIQTSYFKVVELLENIFEGKDITTTDSTTLPNSHAGRVLFNEIVGGMEQKTTSGTQLFDAESVEVVKGGIGYQTGVGYDSETSIRTSLIDIIGNQSISMSCDIAMYRIFEYADGTFIKYTTLNDVTESTIALSETTTGIRFVFNVDSVTDANIAVIKNTLMVNYGEEIKPWEPFTNGASPNPDYQQPINGSVIEKVRVHGKQLFDASATPYTKKHDYSFDKESGDYSFTSSTKYLMNRWKIKVKPNADITITAKKISPNVIVQISNTSLDGTIDTRLNSNKLKATVNTLDFTELSVSIFVNTDSSGTVEANGIMVSYDADATYEPYQGKEITLSNPITLYNDVLRENVERKYKPITLNGGEAWKLNSAGTGYYITISDAPTTLNSPVYSTHFVRDVSLQENGICLGNGISPVLVISSKMFATVDDLKTWLAEKTPLVVYELAESTTEELPTIDRIALNSLPTFNGVTYVEFVDVGVMPTVSIDYGTSKVGGMTLEGLLAGINGELQSQLNNDRITALESAVVNNV